jgi:hypothetical protein
MDNGKGLAGNFTVKVIRFKNYIFYAKDAIKK